MKFVIFFVLIGLIVSDLSVDWDQFKRDNNKQYSSSADEIERKQIFIENVNRMRSHQQTYPDATFSMGINHITDRRIEELVSGTKSDFQSSPVLFKSSVEVKNLPESLDWRTKGVISPVQNEGLVGEMVVAIVSTELVETLYAISNNNNLIAGSVARVFDCCPQPVDTFDCIKNLSGICRQTDYPDSTGICEPDKCNPFTTFDQIKRLTGNDENTMLAWIQDSTLWAELDASRVGFSQYIRGVYDDSTCSQTEIDHVVQIVGYGTDGDKPYWLCKNSWGAEWGENGYIRIARGKNVCGIATVVVQVANSETPTSSITTSTSSTTTSTSSATTSTSSTTTSTSSATGFYTTGHFSFVLLLAMSILRSITIY